MIEINYNEFIELSKKFNDKPFDVTTAFADYQISKGIDEYPNTNSFFQTFVLPSLVSNLVVEISCKILQDLSELRCARRQMIFWQFPRC